MKLGVLSAALADMTMEEMFQYFNKIGVDAVELGAGGFPGKAHVNPAELLKNPGDIDKIGELAKKYNIHIAALACHGNPVHPTKEIAEDLQKHFGSAIDKKKIVLESEIKAFGTYKAEVRLHPEVKASFYVTITEE